MLIDGDVRAVVDTNVLLSGLLWHGKPHVLIEQVRAGVLTLVSSPALLAELADVSARPKFKDAFARSNTDPELMLAQLRSLAEIVDPPPLPRPVSRDPDDDAVLALAVRPTRPRHHRRQGPACPQRPCGHSHPKRGRGCQST